MARPDGFDVFPIDECEPETRSRDLGCQKSTSEYGEISKDGTFLSLPAHVDARIVDASGDACLDACPSACRTENIDVVDPGSRFLLRKTRASANNEDCSQQKRCRLSEDNRPMVVRQVVEQTFVQFIDCKTKTCPTNSRHKDLEANICGTMPNKYYTGVQVVAYCYHSIGPMQLQTQCRCGQIRIFTHRRAVRKGIAITYFATDKCTCGQPHTDKLLVCFCGALFRTTHSLYSCPCFGQLGPAFEAFPNYARFAPRPCPCPQNQKRHDCHCIQSAYTRFQTV